MIVVCGCCSTVQHHVAVEDLENVTTLGLDWSVDDLARPHIVCQDAKKLSRKSEKQHVK